MVVDSSIYWRNNKIFLKNPHQCAEVNKNGRQGQECKFDKRRVSNGTAFGVFEEVGGNKGQNVGRQIGGAYIRGKPYGNCTLQAGEKIGELRFEKEKIFP